MTHLAATRRLCGVVVTFDPHPLRVLVGPSTPPCITLREQKMDLLEELGVDVVLELPFTSALAALEPETFVKKILADGLHTRELVVGYDYSFGKGRRGDYALLRDLGHLHGYSTRQLEPVMINDAIVSSTRIRDMLKVGDVWAARALLGRYFVVQGQVVRGRDRGAKLLGFPTANVAVRNDLLPQGGVYAVWMMFNGSVFPAAANIGYNPTFGGDGLSVEVHILDFDQDIYGRDVRVHFVQRIRSERKFESIEALKNRIQEDVDLARRILASPGAGL